VAIAEVCRNLVCSGAEPIGITDCLNFGNPERPEVMDSFAKAIDGIRAACLALEVPIVSGNVSLYNETSTGAANGRETASRAILPTPAVAAVGLVAAFNHIVRAAFRREKDVVVLFGRPASLGARGLCASEWLVRKMGRLAGEAPGIDLQLEARLQRLILELARAGLLESAHDVSDGGLAVALAECCTVGDGQVGARIELAAEPSALHATAVLFGEAPSRVVASLSPASADRALEQARRAGVPASFIGQTGGNTLSIDIAPLGNLTVATVDLSASRESCLRSIVGS
jgi:phosphoribosylformylglycinamidine synthase